MSFHKSNTDGSISSVGTIFDLNKKTSVTLSHSSSKYFLCRLQTFQFQLESIVSASTLEFKLTADEEGDDIIINNTSGSIDFGLTTTNKGSVQIVIDALLYSDVETFYIFPKVDTGSCNISNVVVTYIADGD